MEKLVEGTINGEPIRTAIPVNLTLLEYLRDLGLKGVKDGCGAGNCGACTVLLEGKPVNACLTLAVEINGCEVTTIEGLSRDGNMSELQQAFIQHGAVQCGFCSPGMLMTAQGLLSENPDPSEPEIRKALAGNLCRCTGYDRIVEAIKAFAHRHQKAR